MFQNLRLKLFKLTVSKYQLISWKINFIVQWKITLSMRKRRLNHQLLLYIEWGLIIKNLLISI
jgi:hypothetical protein